MKRHHPKQSSFDFGGMDDGEPVRTNPQTTQLNETSVNHNRLDSHHYRVLDGLFNEGLDCPVPSHFPTGGTRRTYDALTALKAVERKDWQELQHLQFRWYCWTCNQWHEFSERFFNEFKGVYPHER